MTAEVATASTTGAVRKNPLYHNYVETQQGLDVMTFEGFEAKTMHRYCEHVFNFPEESNDMLIALEITDVIDKAFIIVSYHCLCRFGKGPLVYHRYKHRQALANFTRESKA